MIIIWRGLGFLWPLTIVAGFLVGSFLGDRLPWAPVELTSLWIAVLFGFLGGKILLRYPDHDFFFLPIQAWNFLFAILAAYLTWGSLTGPRESTAKESRDEKIGLSSEESQGTNEDAVLTVQVSSSDREKVAAEFVLPTSMRSWTDDSGREIQAELLMIRREFEGDFTVSIRRESGKEHTFSYRRFDEAGEKFIEQCFHANQ